MLLKDVAVQLMRHLCNCSQHGYSQANRWGNNSGTCAVEVNGKIYNVAKGDRDCSSAVISAYTAAGINCGGATYTGNMRQLMTGTGNFRWHSINSGYTAKSGDIYLNEKYHTAMCVGSNQLAEFSGATNSSAGDQSGTESHIRTYYDFPWDGILECVCSVSDGKWVWDQGKTTWWYQYNDGSYAKNGWKQIDNVWYYFDANGYALKNEWVLHKGFWYYLNDNCSMATGWKWVDTAWYYFTPQATNKYPMGAMQIGWEFIDGEWYYLNETTNAEHKQGDMLTGLFNVDGYTYYCRQYEENGHPGGSMVTGWYWITDSWYYFAVDRSVQMTGAMFKNQWVHENGKSYYLKADGRMARNETLTISGKTYTFNDSGEAQ